ncbi:hypothetical protein QUF80_05950 [Desulfococcaceae bacterium HSG8]|nr:hypothetical protein [Desulfococcaceae bacterium HSG8]
MRKITGQDHENLPRGVVTARKCDCCGHHEIGITTQDGEYIQLKPGMLIQVLEEINYKRQIK